MRNLFLIIAFIHVAAVSVNAQEKLKESSIPETVKSKFKALYPNTKAEYWTKEEGNYVAEFDQQKKEMIIYITPDGKALKTETRIHPSGLPKEAKDYIVMHYPGKKITDAVTSTDLNGNRIYEAEVNEFDLIFDVKGKFIKSVKERPVE
ncbi:PepSY-like domain-containing protein [Flavitalea flava]